MTTYQFVGEAHYGRFAVCIRASGHRQRITLKIAACRQKWFHRLN